MTTAIHVASVLRAAGADDRHPLAEMLSALSLRSSFQRFFNGGFRVTEKTLDVLLCISGDGRAFVAVEGERVIAHAMWASSHSGPRRAEIAFVTAADRRGHGLATSLTSMALADAAQRGMVQAEATVLAANPGGHRVLQRLLPHAARTSEHGEITYVAALRDDSRPVYRPGGRRPTSAGCLLLPAPRRRDRLVQSQRPD